MAKSIKDAFGNKIKRYLTPLKEGETAEFVLLEKGRPDPAREGKPLQPGDTLLASKEYVTDPDSKQRILVEFIDGYDVTFNEAGHKIEKPIYKKPYFVDGSLKLDHTQNEQYYALMISNKNKGNPFRDKKVKTVFEKLDSKAIARKQYDQDELEFEAKMIIRTSNIQEVGAIVDKLPKQYDVPVDDLFTARTALSKIANKDPMAIIKASSDVKAKIKVQVRDAMDLMMLTFDEEQRTFFYLTKTEAKELVKVEVGEDRMEKIVEYFETPEGRKHYQIMASELKKLATV